jgi:hypothetical protein
VSTLPYSSSGLVAPLWAVVVLGLWRAVLAVVAVRAFRHRPLLVPLVPLVALGTWVAALTAGERLLGWTP